MGRDQKRTKDGRYTFDNTRAGLPATGKAVLPYDEEPASTEEPAVTARCPNISAMDMTKYTASSDPAVRSAAFFNPGRRSLYKETEANCLRLLEKKGRVTKAELATLTPQAQEYLTLQRRYERANREQRRALSEDLRRYVGSPQLADDTFLLMAHSGHVSELTGRRDIDAYRADTLIHCASYDHNRALISEALASNRHLHPTAWDPIENHGGSPRTIQAAVANPTYPANRANIIAEGWCMHIERIKDPETETFQPRLGQLFAKRNDLTPENRQRVNECNKAWVKYANHMNARNAKLAQERAHMWLGTGNYDPDNAPADI